MSIWNDPSFNKRLAKRINQAGERQQKAQSMFKFEARPRVNPQARLSTDVFKQEVDKLVEGGMSKAEAIKLLSKELRLSEPQPTGNWFSQFRDNYTRR